MPTQSQYHSLWELIKPLETGMLSTHHRGRIHSRPMALVQDEFNGTLYFFTSDDSLKVAEVTEEQEVGLSFNSPKKDTYVSLSGNARVTRNRELIEKFWNSKVDAYFPGGKEDPHLALLEIDIDAAEIWDSKTNKMSDFFKAAKAKLKDERPATGKNEQFGEL